MEPEKHSPADWRKEKNGPWPKFPTEEDHKKNDEDTPDTRDS